MRWQPRHWGLKQTKLNQNIRVVASIFVLPQGDPIEIPTTAKNSGWSGWGPREGFSTSTPSCRADPPGDRWPPKLPAALPWQHPALPSFQEQSDLTSMLLRREKHICHDERLLGNKVILGVVKDFSY